MCEFGGRWPFWYAQHPPERTTVDASRHGTRAGRIVCWRPCMTACRNICQGEARWPASRVHAGCLSQCIRRHNCARASRVIRRQHSYDDDRCGRHERKRVSGARRQGIRRPAPSISRVPSRVTPLRYMSPGSVDRDWAISTDTLSNVAITPELAARMNGRGQLVRWRLDLQRGIAIREDASPNLAQYAVPLTPMLGCICRRRRRARRYWEHSSHASCRRRSSRALPLRRGRVRARRGCPRPAAGVGSAGASAPTTRCARWCATARGHASSRPSAVESRTWGPQEGLFGCAAVGETPVAQELTLSFVPDME